MDSADPIALGSERTAEHAVSAALDRADAAGDLNAFTELFHDDAIARAKQIDARLAADPDAEHALPLAGVPVAIKDNICLTTGRTTCGSRMLEHYRSPYTATAAQKLIDAGAVIIGKTNMDEFAMGSSGERSAFGPTRNPRARERVTGGSSSGSAAAVGAGVVPIALGSDTGGSIRQPASHCGCVGLKPTYGRVSRFGLVAYASSLDQIGPIASSVRGAARCLDAIAGHDPRDATSSTRAAESFTRDLDRPIEGLRIGMPRAIASSRQGPTDHPATHPAVDDAVLHAERALESAGAEIVPVDLRHAEHAVAAYYVLAPAEASSNLARYDGVRYGHRAGLRPTGTDGGAMSLEEMYTRTRTEGFGPEVRRRIMLGTHVLSSGYHEAYYLTALKARRLIKADYDEAFAAGCHAILMPTAPGPAFRLGEKLEDPMAMYLEDLYTVGVNLAGLPAISVPVAHAEAEDDGEPVSLPIGVQLIGPAWREAELLRAARMLEAGVGRGDSAG